MSHFNNLDLQPEIIKGIDDAGFVEPFPIQEKTIGIILEGLDIIGQSKTGSGKTAAYGIAMLEKIDPTKRRIQSIILVPTRELTLQVSDELKKIGKHLGVKILSIYGGQSIGKQIAALDFGVHIVAGTPGRVIDHIKRGTLDLDKVQFVVLDEADLMLDMGFIDDVEFILNVIPDNRQISLFSATMPPKIIALSKKHMNSPEKVLLDPGDPSVSTLDQYFLAINHREKLSSLKTILDKENKGSTIIFCRTRHDARRLVKDLSYDSYNVVQLQGDLSQHQRNRSMKLFRSGQASILIATDIASRGIDVRHVDCVINLDVPENPLHYFHRIGRTARAGDEGKSYTFVTERDVEDFKRIQKLTKTKIKPLSSSDETFLQTHSSNNSSISGLGSFSGRRNRSSNKKYYRESSSKRPYGYKRGSSSSRGKNSQKPNRSVSSESNKNSSKINNTSNSIKRNSTRKRRWYK